jgi:hypothetical protein
MTRNPFARLGNLVRRRREQREQQAREQAAYAEASEALTVRLIEALEEWTEADPAADFAEGSFEQVVMDGLMCDVCVTPYPPTGHTYPRPCP